MFVFIDYQKLVLQAYEHKKAASQLSLNLSQPTPAKLKEACLQACEKNYNKKDRRVLERFFGEGENMEAILKAIKKYEPDKFKPLLNFIKRKTELPEDKNVELLAWLIDFENRPFDPRKSYEVIRIEETEKEITPKNLNEEENILLQPKTIIPDSESQLGQPTKLSEKQRPNNFLIKPTEAPKSRSIRNVTLTITTILVVAILIIYGGRQYKVNSLFLSSSRQLCMYWTGDHYELISCTTKHGDTLIIALDSTRLLHFKKIMRPDTITYNDIGTVWYLKSNGNIEFFTSSGYHPVQVARILNPISKYIIDRHILHK